MSQLHQICTVTLLEHQFWKLIFWPKLCSTHLDWTFRYMNFLPAPPFFLLLQVENVKNSNVTQNAIFRRQQFNIQLCALTLFLGVKPIFIYFLRLYRSKLKQLFWDIYIFSWKYGHLLRTGPNWAKWKYISLY